MAASPRQKVLKELYSMMASGASRDRYASILTRLAMHEEDHKSADRYWRNALMAYLTKGTAVKEVPDPVVPSPFG